MATIDAMVAEVRDELGSPAEMIGKAGMAAPRFELFHAANSICSQKVRTVLAYHAIPHVARTVSLFTGQTYLPSYVRLRVLGCDQSASELATTHDGSTSASDRGCDAAVVPTLIDWQDGAVVVDSKRICLHLDVQMPPETQLRPAARAADIDAELAVVDNLPNYQMLVSLLSGAADTPAGKATGSGPNFSLGKVARCKAYMAQFADDADLVRAYGAKRDKEQQAADRLFSPDAMQAAHIAAESACKQLDARLNGGRQWLFGDEPTMADLFWMVELLRMANVGASAFWEGGRLPRVARLAAAAHTFPATRAAIIDWPGALY